MATATLECLRCKRSFTLNTSPANIARQKFCGRRCAAESYKVIPPMRERFRERLEERAAPQPNGCILYTGQNNGTYGQIEYRRRTYLVHRVAYELHKGAIPADMCVCHSCDRPLCINPAHLWLGTYRDNNHDMIGKGRARYAPRSRLSESDVAAVVSAAMNGERHSAIAKRHGICASYVSMLKNGHRRAAAQSA